MKTESAGNPNAVSPAGAQGLFQFMPATAKAYGVNPFDPQSAAVGAARMYGDLSKQFGGGVPSMLAAYNWGSGNLTKKGIQNAPQETRDYIQRVQSGMTTPNQQYAQADTGVMNDAGAQSNSPQDATIQWYLEGEKAGILNDEEKKWVAEGRAAGFIPGNGAEQPTSQRPTSKDFAARMGEDFSKRKEQAQQAANRSAAGKQNLVQDAFQAGGLLIGGASDIVGNVLGSAGRYAHDNAPETLDAIGGDIKAGAKSVGSAIYNQAPETFDAAGAQVKDKIAAYQDWAKANPAEAATIGGAANIASVLPVGKIAGKVGQVVEDTTKAVGRTVRESGESAAEAAKSKLASDLYTPKLTPAVMKERAANTVTKGINQKPVYVPPANEADAIKALQELPIKKTNTLQKNLNIVSGAVSNEAKSLSSILQKTSVKYKPEFFSNKLDDTLNQIKTDPLVIGEGEVVAERVFNKMKEISAENPNTPDGLLKSRQQFDAWATSKKGRVFDANDTAFSTAVKNARNTVNKHIEDITTPPSVQKFAEMKSELNSHIDEYTKLKELERHLQNTVKGTVEFSNRQGGIWRRRSITAAAEDAKNLGNVKNQITRQEKVIKDTESIINNIPTSHAAVKASLQKQSHLLGAMDNMETKIPWAPKTRLGMAKESVGKLIPDSGVGKLTGLAALGGIGYAAPAVAAGTAALGGIGYGAYKAVTSPLLRRALGTATEASASVIQPAIALTPLAAFGAKFDRKVINKPTGIAQ